MEICEREKKEVRLKGEREGEQMKASKVCTYRANQNLRGYSLILGTRVANGYMYNKAVMFGQLSCSPGNLHATR